MAKKNEDKTLPFKKDRGSFSTIDKQEYIHVGGEFADELARRYGNHFSVTFGRDDKGRKVERICTDRGILREDRIITRDGYEVIKYDSDREPERRTVFRKKMVLGEDYQYHEEFEKIYIEHLNGSLDRPTYSVDYTYGKTERTYDKKGKVKEKIVTREWEDGPSKRKIEIKKYKGEDLLQSREATLIENFYGGDRRETTTFSDGTGKLIQKKRVCFRKKTGTQTIFIYDGKGREISKKVIVDFQGKYAEMIPNRGFFSRLKGRLFGKNGDKGGKVVASGLEGLSAHILEDGKRFPIRKVDQDRNNTNIKLQEVLKDGSLSEYQKRKQRRKIVAEFYEQNELEHPNKKVGAALKKYLPKKKEDDR